jgi:hypothetical protein
MLTDKDIELLKPKELKEYEDLSIRQTVLEEKLRQLIFKRRKAGNK